MFSSQTDVSWNQGLVRVRVRVTELVEPVLVL